MRLLVVLLLGVPRDAPQPDPVLPVGLPRGVRERGSAPEKGGHSPMLLFH